MPSSRGAIPVFGRTTWLPPSGRRCEDAPRDRTARGAGARAARGIALLARAASVVLGLLIGGLAGSRGGWIDSLLMRLADVVAVLPAIYLVVILRAALPLVLSAGVKIAILVALLSIVGT